MHHKQLSVSTDSSALSYTHLGLISCAMLLPSLVHLTMQQSSPFDKDMSLCRTGGNFLPELMMRRHQLMTKYAGILEAFPFAVVQLSLSESRRSSHAIAQGAGVIGNVLAGTLGCRNWYGHNTIAAIELGFGTGMSLQGKGLTSLVIANNISLVLMITYNTNINCHTIPEASTATLIGIGIIKMSDYLSTYPSVKTVSKAIYRGLSSSKDAFVYYAEKACCHRPTKED